MTVPPGVSGKVIDAKVFSRRGLPKDDRTRLIEDEEIERLEKDRDDEIGIISQVAREKVETILSGQKVLSDLEKNGKIRIKKGDVIVSGILGNIPVSSLVNLSVEDAVPRNRPSRFWNRPRNRSKGKEHFNRQVSRFEKGDDLPPGVLKLIKISVAMERVLSVGDKMAGAMGTKVWFPGF